MKGMYIILNYTIILFLSIVLSRPVFLLYIQSRSSNICLTPFPYMSSEPLVEYFCMTDGWN